MHLGPDEFLVVADVRFHDDLDTEDIAKTIDRVEAAIREAEPGAVRIYVEPEIRFRERAIARCAWPSSPSTTRAPRDPVLGVWAHRQALAARDAGADVRVLVLHRPVPSQAALRARDPQALLAPLRQPLHAELDGIARRPTCRSSPRRGRAPTAAGARWAAPSLALALRQLRRGFPFDLVHAHYAAPAGDAVRRARPGARSSSPCTAATCCRRRRAPAATRGHAARSRGARLVLANSAGIERRARELGAARTRVVHLGTDVPRERSREPAPRRSPPSATWSRASATPTCCGRCGCCATRTPTCAGWWPATARSGPRSSSMIRELGLGGRVQAARPARARPRRARVAQAATVFALPSIDEAFGVAYVEAMAGGVPAIGCRGEAGPEEIAASGAGHPARPAGRSRGARGRAARAARRRGLAPRARRRRARDRRARVHVGGLRARDGRRLRGGAAVTQPGPVRHQPRAAVPGRRVRELHEREDVPSRSSAATCATAAATADEELRSRCCGRAQRDVARARRLGRLPRRRGRPFGPRRAALRLRRRAPRRGVPFVLWATIWAHPRTRRARALLPAAAPPLPPRGRDRHLRPARVGLCAREGRAADRRRGAPDRSTTRIWNGHAEPIRRAEFQAAFVGRIDAGKGTASAHPGLEDFGPAGTRAPRWFWSAAVRSEPGPSPPARSCPKALAARRSTQLLRRQRRCGRTFGPHARLSASRGGWW